MLLGLCYDVFIPLLQVLDPERRQHRGAVQPNGGHGSAFGRSHTDHPRKVSAICALALLCVLIGLSSCALSDFPVFDV